MMPAMLMTLSLSVSDKTAGALLSLLFASEDTILTSLTNLGIR